MPSRFLRRQYQQKKNTQQKQQQRMRMGMMTSSRMAHQGNPAAATAVPVAHKAAHIHSLTVPIVDGCPHLSDWLSH